MLGFDITYVKHVRWWVYSKNMKVQLMGHTDGSHYWFLQLGRLRVTWN